MWRPFRSSHAAPARGAPGEGIVPAEPSREDLPSYYGFGILDAASVGMREGALVANYMADGQVVHAIEWSGTGCNIRTFVDGRILGFSHGQDFKAAHTQLFFAMLSQDPAQYPWIQKLVPAVQAAGNIRCLPPKSAHDHQVFAYFPAGLMFLFRQVVVASNAQQWAKLKTMMTQRHTRAGLVWNESQGLVAMPAAQTEVPLLTFYGEFPGIIVILTSAGQVARKDVTLVEFTAPLAYTVAAAHAWAASDLIPPERRHRLMVVDASHTAAVEASTDGTDGIAGFAVFREGLGVELAGVEQLLLDNAERFINWTGG